MRFFRNASYKFIEKRRPAYVASAVALAVGIGAMLFNIVSTGNWQNYGVDFTGGVLVQVRFNQDVEVGTLRSALGGAQAPAISRFGEDNEYTIRAALREGVEVETLAADLSAQVQSAFGAGSFEIVRTEVVGPTIGAELQQKAAGAILFSLLITLIYIAIRFEFRFGVAAVVATFHDILLTLGVLALFRVEIALTTVAAILTIVGYSLNDTIVVFDRIRENQNRKGGRKEDPVQLLDRSINEVLPRTVLTSGTTLAVLMALLLLGGAVIRDFTLVLILGVLIGTYSSIFVATPVLLEIRQRFADKEPREKKPRPAPATV
jgi:preprotein translocase subunit SecF